MCNIAQLLVLWKSQFVARRVLSSLVDDFFDARDSPLREVSIEIDFANDPIVKVVDC